MPKKVMYYRMAHKVPSGHLVYCWILLSDPEHLVIIFANNISLQYLSDYDTHIKNNKTDWSPLKSGWPWTSLACMWYPQTIYMFSNLYLFQQQQILDKLMSTHFCLNFFKQFFWNHTKSIQTNSGLSWSDCQDWSSLVNLSQAWSGMFWLGMVWSGLVTLGQAWLDLIRVGKLNMLGQAWKGLIRHCVDWSGLVMLGLARKDFAKPGQDSQAWSGLINLSQPWSDLITLGQAW